MQKSESLAVLGEPVDFPSGQLLVLPWNLPKAGDTFDELGALYKKCRGEK